MSEFKSGFVSIIGRPNVGKSTFINYVLGKKVSIISPKPQTTRNKLQGIYTTENEQIIFIDTPGIHKPQNKLGDFMNKEAYSSLEEVDMIMLLVDGTTEFGSGDEYVLNILKKVETKKILVINKIDLVNEGSKKNPRILENLNKSIEKFQENLEFEKTVMISSLTGENVEGLIKYISDNLEEGPMYYPQEQISDHPENFIIGEMIREKVLLLTKEEVPHSVATFVENLKVDEENPNLCLINAVIVVERDSQKKIIIGKGGQMIKNIGTLARKDIMMFLGMKIYLELWVRVEDKWRDRPSQLKKLGYYSDIDE